MILNYTKNQMILLLGGSTTTYPAAFMLGTGSGTLVNTQTTLFNPTDRQGFTGSQFNGQFTLQYQGDWSSTEMSGTQLREFGIVGAGSGTNGSMYSKTIIPALTFDGTNELRIIENWEVF